ncbi:hypothetical protein [Nonomuraea sp. SBT364]|uniref:hypothetical protein n=1 Tax=Nonomuraea sp. SBT364 TaxID=1580530 RepID=UPI000ACAAE4B|nr:hypothetical protein [Nonomuraea sp. SBT364]
MHEQRQAFLDNLETELTSAPSNHPETGSGRVRRSHINGMKMRRGLAGALLAGASFLAFAAAPAQAAGAPPVIKPSSVAEANCFTPDFVPWDHTKTCGNPIAFVNWTFVDEQWTTPYYVCYVFDGWWYGCGGGTELPRASACGYDWGGPED